MQNVKFLAFALVAVAPALLCGGAFDQDSTNQLREIYKKAFAARQSIIRSDYFDLIGFINSDHSCSEAAVPVNASKRHFEDFLSTMDKMIDRKQSINEIITFVQDKYNNTPEVDTDLRDNLIRNCPDIVDSITHFQSAIAKVMSNTLTDLEGLERSSATASLATSPAFGYDQHKTPTVAQEDEGTSLLPLEEKNLPVMHEQEAAEPIQPVAGIEDELRKVEDELATVQLLARQAEAAGNIDLAIQYIAQIEDLTAQEKELLKETKLRQEAEDELFARQLQEQLNLA